MLISGELALSTHDQVLRNQSVGSTSSDAVSLPRLVMVMRIAISSISSLAYSTCTSKYRSSSKTPVSSSSNSGSLPFRACDSPHKLAVRESSLRILVQKLHIRVRRRGVEIEVVLLYIFAMIAFAARQAEKPLFQDRILAIP